MSIIAIPGILKEKFGETVSQALVDLMERFERRLSEEIGKLKIEMHDMRANIIMWMFIFWVGQVGTITAILFAFFRK